MKALAKLGFSQSYTYFTWRNFKQEMEEYLTELTSPPVADYMRGNLWPNTPDILPEFLQRSGPGGFRLRAALAATLSTHLGHVLRLRAVRGHARMPGKEEYLDSEKYELKAWDLDRPGNIRGYIAAAQRHPPRAPRLPALRQPALPPRRTTSRCSSTCKRTPDGSSQVLVAVSLDPVRTRRSPCCMSRCEELGIQPDETYQVHELMTDEREPVAGAHRARASHPRAARGHLGRVPLPPQRTGVRLLRMRPHASL